MGWLDDLSSAVSNAAGTVATVADAPRAIGEAIGSAPRQLGQQVGTTLRQQAAPAAQQGAAVASNVGSSLASAASRATDAAGNTIQAAESAIGGAISNTVGAVARVSMLYMALAAVAIIGAIAIAIYMIHSGALERILEAVGPMVAAGAAA